MDLVAELAAATARAAADIVMAVCAPDFAVQWKQGSDPQWWKMRLRLAQPSVEAPLDGL